MYLCDIWRRQSSSDIWVESLCDLIAKWRPLAWAVERGQILSAMGPLINQRMRERGTYVRLEHFASRYDKAVRAQSIRGRMALNGLYVPTDAAWFPAFRSELLSFPAGRHDDCVDSLALCGLLVDQMVKGRAPDPKENRIVNVRRPTWNEMFRKHQRRIRRYEDAGTYVRTH
jgi:predicted phage terminase large subunit-like protein